MPTSDFLGVMREVEQRFEELRTQHTREAHLEALIECKDAFDTYLFATLRRVGDERDAETKAGRTLPPLSVLGVALLGAARYYDEKQRELGMPAPAVPNVTLMRPRPPEKPC